MSGKKGLTISWSGPGRARKRARFLKKMLFFGCLTLTGYAAAVMVLCWRTETLPPDALTFALFGFWGIEGGWSALLKKGEKREEDEREEKPHP